MVICELIAIPSRPRLTQSNFNHLVPPTKFYHLQTIRKKQGSNLDGLECIEVVESTKWSKLGWVTLLPFFIYRPRVTWLSYHTVFKFSTTCFFRSWVTWTSLHSSLTASTFTSPSRSCCCVSPRCSVWAVACYTVSASSSLWATTTSLQNWWMRAGTWCTEVSCAVNTRI